MGNVEVTYGGVLPASAIKGMDLVFNRGGVAIYLEYNRAGDVISGLIGWGKYIARNDLAVAAGFLDVARAHEDMSEAAKRLLQGLIDDLKTKYNTLL